MVTIEDARRATTAFEFHLSRLDAINEAYGSEQVTAGEFDAAFSTMKFFRTRAFKTSQMLDGSERAVLRAERQAHDVAKFRTRVTIELP